MEQAKGMRAVNRILFLLLGTSSIFNVVIDGELMLAIVTEISTLVRSMLFEEI
jgi:hypothetical protein